MQHDKENRMMDFTDEELALLHEPRTPVDERVAPYILNHAARLSSSCVTELEYCYVTKSETRARNESRVALLRDRSAQLEQLRLELTIVAAEVELRQIIENR